MSYNNSGFEFCGGQNSQETVEKDDRGGPADVQQDEPRIPSDNATPKIEFHGHRVHFFTRNPVASEETALIQEDQGNAYISTTTSKSPSKVSSKFRFMHASIALSDLLHKIVYTSLVASFVLFARSYLECDATNSMMILYAVISCCLLTSATFMICMDVCLRKLSIIITCSLIYLIGISIISWLSGNFRAESSACRWWSIFALYLVCFGEAGTRTALPEFGMIHFANGELDRYNVYLWRFHWITNLFLIVAVATITAVQQKYKFEEGYYVCIGVCFAGFILFMVPFRSYKKSQLLHSSSLRCIWNIINEARDIKRGSRKIKRSSTIEDDVGNRTENPRSWIDYAMTKHGGTYEESEVQEVKYLFSVVALFLCLIPYWIVYAQIYSTFYYQGLHLDARVGKTSIPISWMSLFCIMAVMIVAPICDKIIYPACESREIHIPVIWKIIFGMVCACLSMIIAGCVESSGISHCSSKSIVQQTIGRLKIDAAKLTIFSQIPQYFLLGLSEVFTGLTALNIAHRLCSRSFRRFATAICYVSMAVGHLIALVIISLGWYPESNYFTSSSVRTYFFSLAGLMGINAIAMAVLIYRMIDIPVRLGTD
eukprot:Seg444.10 transcript_id=Seg444.10/GoldUCD/mRNA.D3Y31 product="Solute carrier family 15 member 4" protein_id=Seg444.10/GoldUCD/D3Y31